MADRLSEALRPLSFRPPVHCVYNPLDYARRPYAQYLERYGTGRREILLLGMNPGPWGMAQTGVPFGEVQLVREWLKIEAEVAQPGLLHPKRPVEGFSCRRSEVSGKRLWGWARERFERPEVFFRRFFVANYCPLIFFEESGRNRTPDTLRRDEKIPLFALCDQALRETVDHLRPRLVLGVGRFASARAAEALAGRDVGIGTLSHPSPANPRANQGWAALVEQELKELGIVI